MRKLMLLVIALIACAARAQTAASITPAAGPPAGGVYATIEGSGFKPCSQTCADPYAISFDPGNFGEVYIQSATEIIVKVPAHPSGTATVSLYFRSGEVRTLQYVYLDTQTVVVPAFATDLHGANGSRWQSELRLTNFSESHATVTVDKFFPRPGTSCTTPAPLDVPPGTTVIKSIGCGSESLSAVEITLPTSLRADCVLINEPTASDECCPRGVSTSIPLLPKSLAYTDRPLPIANIAAAVGAQRVNLFIIAPQGWFVRVEVHSVENPERVYVKLEDVGVGQLHVLSGIVEEGVAAGELPPSGHYWIWLRRQTGLPTIFPPLIAFASVIDNETNDSTIFLTGATALSVFSH